MKMITAVFYHKTTGQIMNVIQCAEQDLKIQTCDPGCTYMEHTGNFLPLGNQYYVRNKKIVPLPERPSMFHEFDYHQQAWVLNKEEAWGNVRYKRDQLLKESDWVTLPDVTLSESKQTHWFNYRQALRDITQQSDPVNIQWPNNPA